ncbi:MAG TPA: DUF1236 domain-containing protein [Xanthobacteraceae bacterium]|jgi:hypothetical protein
MTLRFFTLVMTMTAAAGFAAAQTPPTSVGSQQKTITHPLPGTPAGPGALSELQLTNAQKVSIANAIHRAGSKPASHINFATNIGAPVPPSIELYVLPDTALSAVPDAKTLKYTTVQNQIVLVDPTRMRVVDVIPAAPGNR